MPAKAEVNHGIQGMNKLHMKDYRNEEIESLTKFSKIFWHLGDIFSYLAIRVAIIIMTIGVGMFLGLVSIDRIRGYFYGTGLIILGLVFFGASVLVKRRLIRSEAVLFRHDGSFNKMEDTDNVKSVNQGQLSQSKYSSKTRKPKRLIGVLVLLSLITILSLVAFRFFVFSPSQAELQEILIQQYGDTGLTITNVHSLSNEGGMASWSKYLVNTITSEGVRVDLHWSQENKTFVDIDVREAYEQAKEAYQKTQSLQGRMNDLGDNLAYIFPKDTEKGAKYDTIHLYFFGVQMGEDSPAYIQRIKGSFLTWLVENQMSGATLRVFFISAGQASVFEEEAYKNRNQIKLVVDSPLMDLADYYVDEYVDAGTFKVLIDKRKADYLQITESNKRRLAPAVRAKIEEYARENKLMDDFFVMEPEVYVNQENFNSYFILSGINNKQTDGEPKSLIICGTFDIASGLFSLETKPAVASYQERDNLIPLAFREIS